VVNPANTRGPAALYVAAGIGAALTAIGVWQALIALAPPLLLASGIVTLVLTAIAWRHHRRDGGVT
jgi:hypothetical protein